MHAAHVDGCTLVILKRTSSAFGIHFQVVASGSLEYDGTTLVLRTDEMMRVISDRELQAIMNVDKTTNIKESVGFDLMLFDDAPATSGS